MKMLFVFNPNSGKAQIKNQLMKIIQVFSKAGYEITVYPTKASLDGYQHILDNEGRYDVLKPQSRINNLSPFLEKEEIILPNPL